MSVAKYKVTFHHLTSEKYLEDYDVPGFIESTSHVTLAKLWDYSIFPRKLLFVAMSKCSRKDQFSRPIGRQVSFKRLMENCHLTGNVFLTKDEKRLLWNVYFPVKQSEIDKLRAENLQLRKTIESFKTFTSVFSDSWLYENPDVDVEYGDLGIITGG